MAKVKAFAMVCWTVYTLGHLIFLVEEAMAAARGPRLVLLSVMFIVGLVMLVTTGFFLSNKRSVDDRGTTGGTNQTSEPGL